VNRRAGAAAGLLALLLASIALSLFALAGCGGNADPFVGLYWEPSTARRVEIRKDGDDYWLYYGAAKKPYQAIRDGDELRITEPMGGQTIVRRGADDATLELETAGKTTLLKRLQQHQ
jgi:hypothetical protein